MVGVKAAADTEKRRWERETLEPALKKAPERVPVSFEMVVVFTWVHVLVFLLIGGIAAQLLALADTRPNLGFGVVLFFVIFEFGFIAGSMVFAEEVLRALAWPAILIGNLMAAAAMGAYFWRRHPDLQIAP